MANRYLFSASLYQPDYREYNNWMLGTSILMEIEFSKPIDEMTLLKALQRTRDCYAVLRLRPILKGGNLLYVNNDKPIKILHSQHNTKMEFGGESTNDYPWFASIHENTLSFSIAHGLVDGLGFAVIIKTLLYYYAKEMGVNCSAKGVYTLDNPMPAQHMKPHATYAKQKPEHKPIASRKLQKASYLEEAYKMSPSCGKRFVRIACNAQQFMKKTEQLCTTPFALESLICFKAMRPMMKSDNPILEARVAASLRQVFNCETTHNFVSSKRIQYVPIDYDGLSDKELCHRFRSEMDKMLNRDNVLSELRFETAFLRGLNAIKPFSFRKALFNKLIEGATTKFLGDSFFLSHWGTIRLPSPITDVVKDINIVLHYKTLAFPLMLESYRVKDKLIINAHTYLKDNTLFDKMIDLLKGYGIDACIEKDYVIHDILYDYRAMKH